MPERPQIGANGLTHIQPMETGTFGKEFPLLAGWLCDAQYTDGTPMGKTRLVVGKESGQLKATLQVADLGGVRLDASGPHPFGAFKALEALLRAQPCPWQTDPFPIGQSGRGKRK